MNRLSDATSPYLLQHAGNPVDWWPWCEEAFEQARARDVPVMLSVGYAACHWCHVMAHESFEDPGTAALLNQHVVAIKVDREERPDVDAVYMAATQAMTGQGGWPMTVFMTPGREPFYCGTYFPREHFQRLVLGVAQAWRENRGSLADQAGRIADVLARQADTLRGSEPVGDLAALCERAVTSLESAFDLRRGGFGQAPKFPPSMVCEFLLRHSERAGASPGQSGAAGTGAEPEASPGQGGELEAGREPEAGGGEPGAAGTGARALAMVSATAQAMARGGMYDQLGGGFARYSVDAGWVVPHFEKMLYDNALLARVYAHLWRRTGDPLARRVASQTCHWMIRELRTPEGGFASALDADSEGEEGRFYVWTPAGLEEVLGPEDGRYAAQVFGVTESGTFEHGRSVLQRRTEPQDEGRFARVCAALLAARERRTRPERDDKVVAAWNGLAIAALAECGLLFGDEEFLAAAETAAGLLAEVHLRDGRLLRTSRDGVAGTSAGVLEDYACVAGGFLVLSGMTGQTRWTALAGELLEVALTRFADGRGGFYDTADDSERLMYRPAEPADGPTPSGASAIADALLSYAAVTGSARHREAALAALGVLAPIADRYPRAAGSGLAVAEAVIVGPVEIAVVGPAADPRTTALRRTALQDAPPGTVFGYGSGDGPGPDGTELPLLAGRGLVDGMPAAYVCREFSCRAPVTDPAELRAALAYPADQADR